VVNRLRIRAGGVVLAVSIVGLGLSGCAGSAAGAPPTPSASGASAPFHVAGNKVVGANGQQFVEYGFVTYCLVHPSLDGCTPATLGGPSPDLDRIRAAATFWHANADRIQVAQEYLFDKAPYDSAYLAELDAQVHLADSLGMVPIVTLQEEPFKDQGPPLPTESAVRFWTFVADHYKNDPMVMFDLYNEPHLKAFHGTDWLWNIWRNGGTVDEAGPPAVHQTFVGDQALVDDIRAAGAANVIVAEGNQTDHDLSEIPKYALSGSNVAYGMEPGLRPGSDDTPARWAANWGTLSDSVPIMMEAWKGWPGAKDCNPNAPTLLPQEMDYLASKHLGMLVWSLQGGDIVVGSNLEQPTSYSGAATQPCTNPPPGQARHGDHPGGAQHATTPPPKTVGPGELILRFFTTNSHPTPVTSAGEHR